MFCRCGVLVAIVIVSHSADSIVRDFIKTERRSLYRAV